VCAEPACAAGEQGEVPRMAVRCLNEDALPSAPELPPVAIHAAMKEAVCQKHPGQSFPCIDEPRKIDILEQRRLDRFVSSDVLVRGAREQQELTVCERAA